MLSPVDSVIRHPGHPPIAIGDVPIGLVAPIHFQPHRDKDREQSFVLRGDDGQRHLVWRLEVQALPDGGSDLAFVVIPLDVEEWTGLLGRSVNVREVLVSSRSGAVVTYTKRRGINGAVTIASTEDTSAEIPREQVPEPTVPDPDTGEPKPNRLFWMPLPKGSPLGESSPAEEHERFARCRRSPPSAQARSQDGTLVAAHQTFVVSSRDDQADEVRRYQRQTDAAVIVEYVGLNG